MSFFKVRLLGVDEIWKDLREEVKHINDRIPTALERVGSEMAENLQEHIQKDFYIPFKPKEYERRQSHPEHGKPMIDATNMDVAVRGRTMAFSYTPDTEHAKHQEFDGSPLPRPSDDLIIWGQYSHHIGATTIPARPFWNNFVNEQINGGIVSNFAEGMTPFYTVIAEGGENDVVSDGTELLDSEYMEELPF